MEEVEGNVWVQEFLAGGGWWQRLKTFKVAATVVGGGSCFAVDIGSLV
jgi:hypothetical protein